MSVLHKESPILSANNNKKYQPITIVYIKNEQMEPSLRPNTKGQACMCWEQAEPMQINFRREKGWGWTGKSNVCQHLPLCRNTQSHIHTHPDTPSPTTPTPTHTPTHSHTHLHTHTRTRTHTPARAHTHTHTHLLVGSTVSRGECIFHLPIDEVTAHRVHQGVGHGANLGLNELYNRHTNTLKAHVIRHLFRTSNTPHAHIKDAYQAGHKHKHT